MLSLHSSGAQSSNVVCITKPKTINKRVMQIINQNAVQSVFRTKEVKNCPVAIISVAGELRKGKSFFLNLMMRYLEFRCANRESEWLNDNEAVLNRSFEWRGGTEGTTEGIMVWREPFWFSNDKHEKIAVFLMDTQGAFDKDSDQYADSVMFSLSIFLSSYQIYNIKDKISASHLGHLKMFSDFGKRVYKKEVIESSQTLLFLMRDWQEADYDYGFDGGQKYVEEVLAESENQSEENKNLCRNLQMSFSDIKCALLPYPGGKVAVRKRQAPPARIKDIDQEFLKTLNEMFEKMFSTIRVKTLGGQEVNGEFIDNMATVLYNQIEKDKFGPGGLIEAFSSAVLKNLIKKCEDLFQGKIHELEKTNISNENDANELHKSFVRDVMTHFNENNTTGLNPLFAQCGSDFEDSLWHRKLVVENLQELSRIGITDLYQALVDDCWDACLKSFKVKYAALTSEYNYVTDEILLEEFESAKEEVLVIFDDVCESEILNAGVRDDAKKLLTKKLDLLKRVFNEENNIHQMTLLLKAKRETFNAALTFFSEAHKIHEDSEAHIEQLQNLKDSLLDEIDSKLNLLPEQLQKAVKCQINLKVPFASVEASEEQMRENWFKEEIRTIKKRERALSSLHFLQADNAKQTPSQVSRLDAMFRVSVKELQSYSKSKSCELYNEKVVGDGIQPQNILEELKISQKEYEKLELERQEKMALKLKRLFVKKYNEDLRKMLDKKTVLDGDLKKHFEKSLARFQKEIVAKYPEIAQKENQQLEMLLKANFSNWEVINNFHKSVYEKKFSKIDKYVNKLSSALGVFHTENVLENTQIMKKPGTWRLNVRPKAPDFKKLKKMT